MKLSYILIPMLLAGTLSAGCQEGRNQSRAARLPDTAARAQKAALPAPSKSKTNFSRVIGWPEGKTPVAPEGFSVRRWADGFQSPRWIYTGPNGDVFVAESATEHKGIKKVGAALSGQSSSSANRITLLRDADGDGLPEQRHTFLTGLKQPFGMLILNGYFYAAATDGLWRYPYKAGQTKLSGPGEKIMDLPAGGYNNHWTRNLLASPDGSRIYVSVGSGSNVGENGMEHEVRRACILEIRPDGSGERIYASGLRNPVGMDWAPGTNTLWTAVNERDKLGDDLVPDYLTSVRENGFYGWPYSYFGQHPDPRFTKEEQKPELVARAIVPDVPLGAHVAALGLAFYTGNTFPKPWNSGAFIGEHGSWNHSRLVGYQVAFVPFAGGKPSGPPRPFLTGFIAEDGKDEVYGRPVGVTVAPDGSLLVADDASDVIWQVQARK